MDNQICQIFVNNKILLKDLKTLELSKFSHKRSYELFLGIDKKGFFTLVFYRKAKSKFVTKELLELEEISKMIQKEFDTNIKKKILLHSSQICSKLTNGTNEEWRFYAFM